MKRLITCSLLFMACSLCMQAQEIFSTNATLVSKSGNKVTLSSTGMHEKKKNAAEIAIKSAFHTLFVSGVEGLNDGKPLIASGKAGDAYMERFFSGNRYTLFLGNYSEKGEPDRLPTKQYRSTVTVEVMYDSLVKDLMENGLMQKPLDKVSMVDVQEEINAFPSITVVPFKKNNESYETLLEDYDTRMAVNKVQEGFEQKNIEVRNFLAYLQAGKSAAAREVDSAADSNERQLLLATGAEVFVTVDMKKDTKPDGMSRVSLSLMAYETATGVPLATKVGWTPSYKTTQFDKLCVLAVQSLLPEFMTSISSSFAQKVNKGLSVALRVTVNKDSFTNLNAQVAGKGSLSSLIRQWVRKNAYGGKYHIQGTNAETIIFDKVQIPPSIDSTMFLEDFADYLTNELDLEVETGTEGSTIYLNIH